MSYLGRFEIHAGRKGDARDRWLAEVIAVRRPAKRKGQQLEVLVRYKGTDADGQAWSDEWRSISDVTNDLKLEARRMEKVKYPEVKAARRPRGTRVSPRMEVIYEVDEQLEDDGWWRRWTEYSREAAECAAGQ